ncbi:LD-carboxypeptidase [Aquibacillus sp. 3ASR75-11]|uniref:LD-carboxypeptidase n=1 Tax=Terrihalobacillus insolitus TaxID=2950438 RepID=A0A9X3WRE3_9BACI|nr:LD-carboxypeptidase [Terrihalobacillus insolitus]MDC3424487.1 LD-carboxypeptidase [Terrihalobacillus insolitus]
MLLPKRLHIGDTIGIIAPASPPNLENLEKGIIFLKSLGLHVKLGKHVTSTYGYLAGTDQKRLDDVHDMFRDNSISGIICASGGYGTARLASQIDYDVIMKNPKIFWGYSDITFLHTAIRQQTDLVTFHGPMVSSDIGTKDFATLSKKMFKQTFEPTHLAYTEAISPLQVLSDGEAIGPLVGGNLSLLISTLGTKFEINTSGKLLVIEDIGEEPYRIDSYLNQLKMTRKFDDAAGIVVGDFNNAIPKEGKSSLTLEEVLQDYFADLNIPVMSGFKIGHCSPHFSVPLGAMAKLSSVDKTLQIQPGVQ